MATVGPFKWKSHTKTLPQNEWDYTCSITGFNPVLNCIQQEMGLSKINSTPSTFSNNVTGLGTYFDQTAGNLYVMVFAGTKGYTGVMSSSITFTDRTGAVTISSSTKYSDVLNAIFVATGGGNVPIKSTSGAGNFANLAGSPPSANLVKTVNNFMFLANAPAAVGTASRVYWSNASDPETWGAANFIDFRKNDGYGITALASIGTTLYIFKNTSIGKLGTTTFTTAGSVSTLGPLETVNYYLGVANGYNLCQMTDGRIAFLATDGNLYIFDGNSTFNASSQRYPGPDLRVFYGGSSAIISDCIVFENPYEKCIYLFSSAGTIGFGYDYINNFWFSTVNYSGSPSANIAIYSLNNSLGQIAPRLIYGTADSIYLSNSSSANDNPCTATMTIRLPYKRKEGIPRSAIFEFNASGSPNTLRARAGINTVPSTYAINNSSATSGRYVIPIAVTNLSSGGNPSEQNVIVELSSPISTSSIYGDVYLSDEFQ